MKNIFRYGILIMLTTMLYGCVPERGDYDITLPNDYSLIRNSAHMITINKQIDESSWNLEIIPAKVVELAFNDNYVLAKQVGLKLRDPNNEDDTYQIPDESKISFWILDTANNQAYGPFTENELNEKKKELSISEDLKLKKVSSYKSN
ncbi:MAG: DUF3997 domain-containing protein [Clostridium sp.]